MADPVRQPAGPNAYFVVGETNMSQTANAWNEEPVGALFAAANALEWLSFGAQSVDWWEVHNYGSPTADFGMFSSATSGEPAMDTPYPPYYGYQLAALLAVKGAKAGTLPIATPNVYSYYSDLPNGSYAVMLVNADPANSYQVSTSSLGITSPSETMYTYDAASPSIVSSGFSGGTVPVPAESILVLTNASGGPPTPTPTTPAPTPTTPTPAPTPPTATPTPTATSSPGPGCQVSWSVVNSWSGGFQLGITVTNSSAAPASAWQVTWSWPGGQALTQIWNASESVSGPAVAAVNASYNGPVPAGGTATFGLLGSGTAPTALTGLQCSAH
jgi:hypothetical protein